MRSRRCAMRRYCNRSIPRSSTISASPASKLAACQMLSRRLQRAVASNPRYADAYFRLGIALEKLGDIGGAIAAYERATELLPSLTEAWFRAGALVYELGHRDEAIGCFRRAAATGGKTSFGRLGKARALLTENRNQEAEQVLRQTLARRSEKRHGA